MNNTYIHGAVGYEESDIWTKNEISTIYLIWFLMSNGISLNYANVHRTICWNECIPAKHLNSIHSSLSCWDFSNCYIGDWMVALNGSPSFLSFVDNPEHSWPQRLTRYFHLLCIPKIFYNLAFYWISFWMELCRSYI